MNNLTKPCVAIIFGGRGYEKEVSSKGAAHVLPLIDKNTYDCLPVFIDGCGRWFIDGKEGYPTLPGGFAVGSEFIPVDCALPLLHGDFGEDGIIQGALECAGISYIGCDVQSGALCSDKAYTKAVAMALGIPTLPQRLILKNDGDPVKLAEEIGYPLFVKPCRLGSSVGASRAADQSGLRAALSLAFSVADRVMVEPALNHKRELECGYFCAKGKELFTKPGEILCEGFYDYGRKYLSDISPVCAVADIDEDISRKIREYSARLVRFIGVRDLCRIDFFLSGGELYFNEINTLPGLTESSLYLGLTEAAGISKKELIALLIDGCIERSR